MKDDLLRYAPPLLKIQVSQLLGAAGGALDTLEHEAKMTEGKNATWNWSRRNHLRNAIAMAQGVDPGNMPIAGDKP